MGGETVVTHDGGDRFGADRAAEIRDAARREWTHDPAGAIGAGDAELGTAESFARVERYRYDEQPWMHETFHFDRYAGQRVLEIGVGLGTDHLQFARGGAVMTGVDLTSRCVDLTRRRFEQEGLVSDLHVMDAEQLEFPDDSFDVVYSFGVLHHVPSTEQAFREVRRVLRPGGVFVGGLYNQRSLVIAAVLAIRVARAEWRRESFQERLSRMEYSTADEPAKPYVRLFTRAELARALIDAGFSEARITKRHMGIRFNRGIPVWLEELAARRAGWYLIHEAG
jgi:ubiquinone/menaquinone biosynthesis C-methylase UbiE